MTVAFEPDSLTSRSGRLESSRPIAGQEADLVRWLQARRAGTSPTVTESEATTNTPTSGSGTIATLRQALRVQGLTALSDPLSRYAKVTKVVRVRDLLNALATRSREDRAPES